MGSSMVRGSMLTNKERGEKVIGKKGRELNGRRISDHIYYNNYKTLV